MDGRENLTPAIQKINEYMSLLSVTNIKGLYLPSSCLRVLRGTEDKFPTPYSGDASEVYISVQFTLDTARIPSQRKIKIKKIPSSYTSCLRQSAPKMFSI